MGALEWFSIKSCFGGCSSLRQTARTFFVIQMVLSVFMFIVIFAYMLFSDAFGGFPKTGLVPFRSTWYSLALLLILSVADFVFSYMAHASTFNDNTAPLGMFCASRGFSLAAYLILFYLTTQWNGSEIMVAMTYLIFAGCSIYLASALYLAETLDIREYEPLDGESQGTGSEDASVTESQRLRGGQYHAQKYQAQLESQYQAELAYAHTQPVSRHSTGVGAVQYGTPYVASPNSQKPGSPGPAALSAASPPAGRVNRGGAGGSNTVVIPVTYRPDPRRESQGQSAAPASAGAQGQRAAAAKASGRPSVAV